MYLILYILFQLFIFGTVVFFLVWHFTQNTNIWGYVFFNFLIFFGLNSSFFIFWSLEESKQFQEGSIWRGKQDQNHHLYTQNPTNNHLEGVLELPDHPHGDQKAWGHFLMINVGAVDSVKVSHMG